MKILVLCSYAKSLINFRGPLLIAMVQAGHQVIACGPKCDAEIVRQVEKMGVSFQEIPLDRTGMNPVRDMGTLFFLLKLIKKERPDAIFSYTIKPVIYGSLAARWTGVKNCYSMITGLGNSFETSSMKKKLVNFLASHLYCFGLKNSKAVFFQNPDDRDFFLKSNLLGKKTNAVLVNGSGLDLNHYSVAPVVKSPTVFLLIARIISEKGVVQYAEAAGQLKKNYNHATFRLVGWFDNNPSAISKETVTEWHRQGTIEYLGAAEDVRPLIASTSVFVLPSYYGEGTPRTVLEAMSMGRPVITTDAPGCRETVKRLNGHSFAMEEKKGRYKVGANGILVPVKDAEALAAAMKFFIDHPEQIEVMGQESRRYAEERYDVNQVNAVLLKEMGLSS